MSSGKQRTWALAMNPGYQSDFKRLQRKYQNQISRKTQDLMNDPTPGGSRTALTQYDGLCRMRAGEFRIIYAYSNSVVELLSLRRRNESTYDDLDQLEIQQFEAFRSLGAGGPVNHSVPEWEELAKKWAAPVAKPPELLPHPVTMEILTELQIPSEYHWALLQLRTVDDLLACDLVPADVCEEVLDWLSPKQLELSDGDPLPVVLLEDLVDEAAATVSGPIDTTDYTESSDVPAPQAAKEYSLSVPAPLFIVSTKRNERMCPYNGNTAKAIGKDARYTVKLNNTIQLTYSVNSAERALLTTDGHSDLVSLVNAAKLQGGASQFGGAFFINEYRHILVPTQSGSVLFAGIYTRDLEFVFDNSLVSPVARSGIRPGVVWPGPHVGMKYVLAAGAADIRYDLTTENGTTRRVQLSQFYSQGELTELLAMFRAVKPAGGAIYINEARECFAPVEGQQGYERLYIGHLGSKPWFPEPE
jgi:mRNA-degrading endonuclease RelE of RelBE toxin-antitoxin system